MSALAFVCVGTYTVVCVFFSVFFVFRKSISRISLYVTLPLHTIQWSYIRSRSESKKINKKRDHNPYTIRYVRLFGISYCCSKQSITVRSAVFLPLNFPYWFLFDRSNVREEGKKDANPCGNTYVLNRFYVSLSIMTILLCFSCAWHKTRHFWRRVSHIHCCTCDQQTKNTGNRLVRLWQHINDMRQNYDHWLAYEQWAYCIGNIS